MAGKRVGHLTFTGDSERLGLAKSGSDSGKRRSKREEGK